MPTFETEIMREARTLARLQRDANAHRAKLREIEKAIKQSKRALRALVNARPAAAAEWHESGAASKVLGIPAGSK